MASLSQYMRNFFGGDPGAQLSWFQRAQARGFSSEQLLIGPSNGNMIAVGQETVDRALTGQSFTLTNDNLILSMFTSRKSETVNSISVLCRGTAAVGLTFAKFGLYQMDSSDNSNAATLIASTVSDTTLFATTFTNYTRNLTAPVNLVTGRRYAIGILVKGASTSPAIYGGASIAAPATFPSTGMYLTGQTDLPATIANNGYAGGNSQFFATIQP